MLSHPPWDSRNRHAASGDVCPAAISSRIGVVATSLAQGPDRLVRLTGERDGRGDPRTHDRTGLPPERERREGRPARVLRPLHDLHLVAGRTRAIPLLENQPTSFVAPKPMLRVRLPTCEALEGLLQQVQSHFLDFRPKQTRYLGRRRSLIVHNTQRAKTESIRTSLTLPLCFVPKLMLPSAYRERRRRAAHRLCSTGHQRAVNREQLVRQQRLHPRAAAEPPEGSAPPHRAATPVTDQSFSATC